MNRSLNELHTLVKHQGARRRHKRAVRTEESVAKALAKAEDREYQASVRHTSTRTAVQDLFKP